MPQNFSIDAHPIGAGGSVFVIAEAGVNHNGSVEMALELIRAAKRAGADCVKFQTFKADRVVMNDAPKARYQTLVTDPAESQIEMLRKLELDENAYGDLIDLCRQSGIAFTSTPYNEEDIDFLDELDVPVIKAASIHCAEPRMLQKMAETGRPVLLSTGMATMKEVETAIEAIRSTGNESFVVLQCTTNYPSSVDDANLRAMATMRERFDCHVGYSDHTQSIVPCIVSVALGATVIEKHFTLDQSLAGPDHSSSETEESFAHLVGCIREAEASLGSAEKAPTEAESLNIEGMRRSLVARRAVRKGNVIRDEDLICKRPATGMPPREWSSVNGRIAARDIAEGAQIHPDDLES